MNGEMYHKNWGFPINSQTSKVSHLKLANTRKEIENNQFLFVILQTNPS